MEHDNTPNSELASPTCLLEKAKIRGLETTMCGSPVGFSAYELL